MHESNVVPPTLEVSSLNEISSEVLVPEATIRDWLMREGVDPRESEQPNFRVSAEFHQKMISRAMRHHAVEVLEVDPQALEIWLITHNASLNALSPEECLVHNMHKVFFDLIAKKKNRRVDPEVSN
ncbi:MAG: hypothetical protein ABIA92_00380 [Patescibacteria group bacterium]